MDRGGPEAKDEGVHGECGRKGGSVHGARKFQDCLVSAAAVSESVAKLLPIAEPEGHLQFFMERMLHAQRLRH